ncbi:MAG: SCO family protein [Gammaproteobacteria bacterium]|nr:SCO family protein [Gammaproteobacteria bacterium]MDH4255414.1 SCO family protein [Gammaproteobacteria bacterium]MDH5311955.1 SCO family protein [Gammaproteobacteria bacterium]
MSPIHQLLSAWKRKIFPLFVTAVVLQGMASAETPVTGEFRLTDQDGAAVTEHTYDGKLRIVFFGFTRCPYVCPTTLHELRRAMLLLGEDSAGIQPIFISIDPANDTPAVLSTYVASFHTSLVGLTGTTEQVRAAADAFRATYGTQPGGDAESAAPYHSNYLYLMDRQGGFLDVIGASARSETIASRIREHLRSPGQSPRAPSPDSN